MTSSQAGFIAKQGLSMLYNATVTSVSAISSGIGMAYKTYTDHYEKNQIDSLKKGGRAPADILHAVLQRFHFLSMAGYNNEVAAAAQKIASKLTSGAEKSTVAFECVAALSGVLVTTCTKYGDFSAGGWGLQDFLNSSRMGKDHFDRDQLVNDFYFAILYAQDVAGGPGAEFDRIIREAAGRMVEGDTYTSETPTGYGAAGAYTPSAYTSSAGLPSYAQAPKAFGSSTSKPATAFGSSSSSSLSDSDPKKKAAKVLNVVASSIKKAVDETEAKRIRSLREAEEMLQKEKQKAAQLTAGGPGAFGGPSGYSTTPSLGGTGSGFGGAAPTSSFGSGSGFGAASAKPTSGFGSTAAFGGGSSSAFGSGSGFGSGTSGFGGGSSGGSTFGGGSGGSNFGGGSTFGGGSGGSGFGSSGGGYGSSSGGYSSLNNKSNPPSGSGNNSSSANFLGL